MKRVLILLIVILLLSVCFCGCSKQPEKQPEDSISIGDGKEIFWGDKKPYRSFVTVRVYSRFFESGMSCGETVQSIIEKDYPDFYIGGVEPYADRSLMLERRWGEEKLVEDRFLGEWQKNWLFKYAWSGSAWFDESVNVINVYCFVPVGHDYEHPGGGTCASIYFVTDIGDYILYGSIFNRPFSYTNPEYERMYLIPVDQYRVLASQYQEVNSQLNGGTFLDATCNLRPYLITHGFTPISANEVIYEDPSFWLGLGIGAAGVAISGAILTVAVMIVKKKSKKKPEESAE
ncbi:MAG: hypothetical protein IJX62_08725 [Clostridia bacterium]|nr:hypothetical protein [Clostridia bacterium]